MPLLKINRKLEPLVTKSKPIKVAIGGRGSGKSIGFGDIFTMKMDTERADVYCLREFQDSITDSVHRVFKDSIEKRLVLDGWDIQENKIVAPNGARTTYKGANRNPDAMQSAQGYKYSWFEEAHRASQASLDKLLPTILRNPGAECWFSANPQSSADPFSQRFIVPYQHYLERDGYYEDDLHIIVVINWRDNPWWNDEQESLRAWDYDNLPRAKYDWIWEGKFNDSVSGAIIPAEWFDAAIDAHIKLGIKPKGSVIAAYDAADDTESDTKNDSKAVAVRHGIVYTQVMQTEEGDINESCDWACSTAISANADIFTWDCDGIGAGLKRQVSQNFEGKKCTVEMFKGSMGVDHPERVYEPDDVTKKPKTNKETFKNKRSQYYWMLRDRFYNTYRAVVKKEYIDPDTMISLSSEIKDLQQLRSEVCRIPLTPNGAGLIQIMSKKDMWKKYQIPSPNMADCLMMSQIIPDISNDEWFGNEINYPKASIA